MWLGVKAYSILICAFGAVRRMRGCCGISEFIPPKNLMSVELDPCACLTLAACALELDCRFFIQMQHACPRCMRKLVCSFDCVVVKSVLHGQLRFLLLSYPTILLSWGARPLDAGELVLSSRDLAEHDGGLFEVSWDFKHHLFV